ncbi:hypothetical protein BKA66DRAFT_555298 [Pyrenochaeta sp. MPI-SDFR-AT-0127]|nr:hypothetical protein BKA66DRAFT_555298 [Pyrenochaeta sp. MPI-SDFR-AT-0127]
MSAPAVPKPFGEIPTATLAATVKKSKTTPTLLVLLLCTNVAIIVLLGLLVSRSFSMVSILSDGFSGLTVSVSGIPTVSMAGTPTVYVTGYPTVYVTGTPTVRVRN